MESTQPQTPPSTQSTGKLLTALILGGITAIMDTTIVAIGLHTLTERLNAPISTIQLPRRAPATCSRWRSRSPS